MKCHNEYQKAWYKKNPKARKTSKEATKRRELEIRDMIKKAKAVPCEDCKKRYPYYVMDFDHCIGKKNFNLSIAANSHKNKEVVQKEIDKCQVVCANCHRERTFSRLIKK